MGPGEHGNKKGSCGINMFPRLQEIFKWPINSIGSSCPLRDPDGVCSETAHNRKKFCPMSLISCKWSMREGKQEIGLFMSFSKTQTSHLRSLLLCSSRYLLKAAIVSVNPGQGQHKYRVTFTLHVLLDSYE